MVEDICMQYTNVDPYIVRSIIFYESSYDPYTTTGDCLGLMQVSQKWHRERMEKLDAYNLYDPYSNILLGVDYISELTDKYESLELVLMLYNMKHETAFRLYNDGIVSKYAQNVIEMSNDLKAGE